MSEKILIGIPTSPGIAIGDAFLFRHDEPEFREFCVLPEGRDDEIARLEAAVQASRRQLVVLKEYMSHQAGEKVAQIFEVQAALLDDEMLIDEVRHLIRIDGTNAEAAVQRTTDALKRSFTSIEEESIRQQAQDIHDVGRRIIQNLLGDAQGAFKPITERMILVADNLLPSDAAHLLEDHIHAVATDQGGAASHTAILTRALEVPAVVGLKHLTTLVETDDKIIVNGNSGKVIIRPTKKTLEAYVVKRRRYEDYIRSLTEVERLPAETTDGKRVALRANLELPQEVRSVLARHAEGVGLFRTEYLFLAHSRLPDEEDQYREYRHVIEALAPHPVSIRTFDLGGDKVFPDMPHPTEANPFMGWRAIRVSLDQPKLLHTQLRAILRAAMGYSAKIIFPLISGVGEVRLIKEHLAEVKQELFIEGQGFNSDVKIGLMIELPSAVVMADKLAKEVDFFTIGTNDLTQFTLAVDRGNERVQRYYRPLHPAMLRFIKMTIDAGHTAGIPVAMCGELAASPLATMLLVGLGIDELSASPVALPQVKKIIRSLSAAEARTFAAEALSRDTEEELTEFIVTATKRRFAELPIWFTDNGEG